MKVEVVRQVETIEEYFFRQNYTIVVGGAIIVMCTNLLWIAVAMKEGDPYGRLSSAAGGFMWMMVLLSAALIIAHKYIKKKSLEGSGLSHQRKKRRGRALRYGVLFYDCMLILSVTSIAIANNKLIAQTTRTPAGMTIALSAVLLTIIAFSPLPRVFDGIVLALVGLIGVVYPLYSTGGEYYAIIPELLLRIGLALAYVVMYLRSKDLFKASQALSENEAAIELKDSKILAMNEELVDLLANAVEMRDVESGEHVKRVKDFTRILAESVMYNCPEYSLTEEQVNDISRASALHDIGKINIPDRILLKPARLTSEEFKLMKKHSEYGYKILMSSEHSRNDEFIRTCSEIALYHHEKFDGKGYPNGVVGDDIPISAQIVSVADCFDALTTERRYKAAYSGEEAFGMIRRGECGAFSIRLMMCFEECKAQFLEIVASK